MSANTTPIVAIATAAHRRPPGPALMAARAPPAKPNTPAIVIPLGLLEANRKIANGTEPITPANAKLRRTCASATSTVATISPTENDHASSRIVKTDGVGRSVTRNPKSA